MPKYGFWFYMGVIYEHTFNRYPREWSSYFNTLPMELHWCLLNLLVKSHFKLSIILLWEKCIATHTIVRGWIKGAACGHIWHIHRAAATAGSILVSQGCIFQPQGSILLSQGCIFSTAREYIAESGVYIWQFITAAQRNGILFCNGMANSPQSSL